MDSLCKNDGAQGTKDPGDGRAQAETPATRPKAASAQANVAEVTFDGLEAPTMNRKV